MRPRPKDKKPSFEDFQVNTADKNRSIAVLWGRQEIRGGNIIWYGDYENSPIIKKTRNIATFGITTIKSTLGYRHFVGFALAFCYGTVDKIYRIKFAEKTAWANESGQAPTGTQVVSNLSLYGGDDGASGGRGGVYSTVELYPGNRTQSASSYLRGLDSEHSAYRGLCYMVWRGASAAGTVASTNNTGVIRSGYVGNNGSLDSVTVEAERCPKALSGANPWYRIGSGDANPVECLYELLTNAEWGLGRTTGYGSSWAAAAHTVYDEGLGFSLVWDSSKSIKAMAQEILDQIGGIIITDNATGNWDIKLARADYDVNTIPVLEAVMPGESATGWDCVIDVSDYSCGAYDETTGVVKVDFNERLYDNNYQANTAMVYDKSNVSIQGQPIIATISYPGVTSYGVAAKLGQRDLVARSLPLKKCRIATDTNGARLKPGDVFILKWDDYRVNQVVFRVLAANPGDIKSGTVELNVVQDIFSLGATQFVAPPLGSWINPVSAPADVSVYKIIDQPRHISGDKINVITMAQKPAGNTNYDLYASEDAGATYSVRADAVDFTPVGTLYAAVTRGSTDIDNTGAFEIVPVSNMQLLENSTASEIAGGANMFLIEGADELLAFETFTVNGSGRYVLSNVWRGLLDTCPQAHSTGAKVWFFSYGGGIPDNANFANALALKTKFVTRSPRGVLDIASATARTFTVGERYQKPYPPGNVALADTSNPGGSYSFNSYISWVDVWSGITYGANGGASLDSFNWYGAARSSNIATAGVGGRLTFQATDVTRNKICGLSDQNNPFGSGGAGGFGFGTDNMRFAWALKSNGKAEIWEMGVRKSALDAYTYTTSSVFEIRVSEEGATTYYIDGVLLYNSTVALATVETYAIRAVVALGAYGGMPTGTGTTQGVQAIANVHFRSPAVVGGTFADDFNDGIIDSSKWIATNSTDVTITETGGEARFTADASFSGAANGASLISTPAMNFTGQSAEITFTAPGNLLGRSGTGAGGTTWLRIFDSANVDNHVYVYCEADLIGYFIRNNGVVVTGSAGSDVNFLAATKWRLRHIVSGNQWAIEYWNGSAWVTHTTLTGATWNPTSAKVYVLGYITSTNQQSVVSAITDITTTCSIGGASVGGQVRVTWAHRNRLTQANIIRQSTTGIATEAAVTYTVKVYGHTGTLLRTVTGLTAELYDYTAAFELADTGLSTLQASLTFEVWAVRGSYTSHHIQTIKVTR